MSEESIALNTDTTSNNTNAAILSNQKFAELPVSDQMKTTLNSLGFEYMTHIQSKSIPDALAGKDIVGAAKTGSGKTLAFLIPIVELLSNVQFRRKQGTGAIVISPTRELALQIYGVLKDIMEAGNYPQTHGLVMGGTNMSAESDKLAKGVNILVATPGKLLDHLTRTQGFQVTRLQMLVIDEADRILDQGFEETMHDILKKLPIERQTILFSATQTRNVNDLARVSMKKDVVHIGVDDNANQATVSNLQQGYVTCQADSRFLLLYTFLRKNKSKKIMVFFSSCNSVKYHAELLNYIDVTVLDIHGNQKQQKRTTTFFQFCKQETGILLCTDVAARGLDIPDVDWIVQYDPPDDPREYIHRVGRTARGLSSKQGKALLFLLPEETQFLRYLEAAKVSIQEYEFPVNKIANISSQLTTLIEKNFYLNKSARDAYRSYLLSYASHSHKDIFNVHNIDLQGVGRAFGFSVPPRVDIDFNTKGDKRNNSNNKRKQFNNSSSISSSSSNSSDNGDNSKKRKFMQSGHAFSAENPYGKRSKDDGRQFSH